MAEAVDVWIVSYERDFSWLRLCARGVAKYFTGWRTLHIALPHSAPDPGICLPFVRHDDAGLHDGYICQQVTKLRAYRETDAPWIAFLDSDHVAFKPVDVSFYFDAELAIIPYRHWDEIEKLPGCGPGVTREACRWRPIVAKAIGHDPNVFTLEYLPFIVHRDTLIETCGTVERVHGCKLEEFAQCQPWREFSEFNMIGNEAWENTPKRYSFRHVDGTIDYRFRGFSPYQGVRPEDRAWCEEVLK